MSGTIRRGEAAVFFVAAALWTAVIYLTLPYTPDIMHAVSSWVGNLVGTDKGGEVVGRIGLAVVGALLAVGLVRTMRSPVLRSVGNLALFVLVAALYGRLAWLITSPAEKLHFLEYGVLSYLLYRAWRAATITAALWPLAFFTGVLIGTCDEYIQHMLPKRHGEFVDVLWNVASVGLPLVIFSLFEAKRPAPSGGERSALRATGAAAILAVTAFILGTQEFANLIEDPRGYALKTRLPSAEAIVSAPPISEHAAAEIRKQHAFNYDSFLEAYPPDREPVVNEFRVHLFRRDRYLAYALHTLVRMDLAGTLDTAGHGLGDLLRFPDARRQARNYAAFYLKDWIGSDLGMAPEGDAAFHEGLLAWMAGDTPVWAERLWGKYLEEHRGKIAKGEGLSLEEALRHLRTAERENVILEDYFGASLEAAGVRWDEEMLEEVQRRLVDGPAPERYVSPVAERAITDFAGWEILLISSFLLLAILRRPDWFALVSWGRIAGAIAFVLYLIYVHPGLFHPASVPSAAALAAGRPLMILDYLEEAPVIDGRLVAGEWPLESVKLVDAATGMPAAPVTRVYAAVGTWAGSGADSVGARCNVPLLVIAFDCEDSEVHAEGTGRDSDLWRGDAVEIFIDMTGEGREYVEIEVNPDGVLYDAMVKFRRSIDFEDSKKWNGAGVVAAASRSAGGWQAEIAIPLRSFDPVERPGTLQWVPTGERPLLMNFCRIDAPSAKRPSWVYQSWSPTRGWFHRPWRFGVSLPHSLMRPASSPRQEGPWRFGTGQ